MQRATATLLIALVALMALLPQAMCPCSLRARADATHAAHVASTPGAPQRSEAPCCPLCSARAQQGLARLEQHGRASGVATKPCDAPGAPKPCPCCGINGQGKQLVLRGDEVKPLAPALLAFVALPALELAFGAVAHVVAARPVVPDALASPPSVLRAGVVLLI